MFRWIGEGVNICVNWSAGECFSDWRTDECSGWLENVNECLGGLGNV